MPEKVFQTTHIRLTLANKRIGKVGKWQVTFVALIPSQTKVIPIKTLLSNSPELALLAGPSQLWTTFFAAKKINDVIEVYPDSSKVWL